MGIAINGLNFSYTQKKILNNITLKIKKGKLTGILGPNGCGKSTLLKTIIGYLKIHQGEILIENIDKNNINKKNLSKIISLVPQKSNLMADMSVEDFVLLGRLPHLKSSWDGYTKYDRKLVSENLKSLNLDKFKDRVALSLSGGEFQRVLLARALTQMPKILLLDEPTSSLDLNHAMELLTSVKNLVDENGITSVAVLHDLNLASIFCDELIIMKEGEILYQGLPKDILTVDILKEVYNLRAKIIEDENGCPYVIPLI